MRFRAPLVVLFAVLFAVPACSKDDKKSETTTESKSEAKDKKKGDDDDGEKKPKKKKKKADDEEDKPQAKDGDDGKDEPAAKGGDDDPSAVPGPRSKAPTRAEMDAADHLEVEGAKELGCDVRMVREWLEIACRGSAAKAPTYLAVTKGKSKDTLLATIPGTSMSVLTPYEPGIELEATFYWADKSRKLALAKWELKKKRPERVATLVDAKEKGLSADEAAGKHYCYCRAASGSGACTGKVGGNLPCFRTYWADCKKLVQCASGDASAPPKCLPGEVLVGGGTSCAKDCAKDGKCPAGLECQPVDGGGKACGQPVD
jgi:hypothetical protein